MIVNADTKYKDFVQYEKVLTKESEADLMKAAEQYFKPCYQLTLNEFWKVLNGNFDLLGDLTEPSVLQVYWIKRFTAFADEFKQSVEKLNTETPEMQGLDANCVKILPQESMLIFIREYFGLPSFMEAGQRTIGEYILARKDRYNEFVLRKAYEAKQKQKLKTR